MTGERGFTLLELIVASAIMAIAVVGLLAGLSGAARNAARLRDYDRAAQLAELRMNELLLDDRFPRNTEVDGAFDASLSGGMESGWRARLSAFEMPPVPAPGQMALDRIELQVWWMEGGQKRSLTLDGYQRRVLKPEDIPPVVVAQ
ncbi:MAG: prepilin-type N-terminal cleavage/methylation domain-containing protein [Bryobacteraceae bacterium]